MGNEQTKIILYPSNFLIVDEDIRNILSEKYKKIFDDKKYSKCEIIINEGKIIMNVDNAQNKNPLLLIGHLDSSDIFIAEMLLNFKDPNEKGKVFSQFNTINYNKNLKINLYHRQSGPKFNLPKKTFDIINIKRENNLNDSLENEDTKK